MKRICLSLISLSFLWGADAFNVVRLQKATFENRGDVPITFDVISQFVVIPQVKDFFATVTTEIVNVLPGHKFQYIDVPRIAAKNYSQGDFQVPLKRTLTLNIGERTEYEVPFPHYVSGVVGATILAWDVSDALSVVLNSGGNSGTERIARELSIYFPEEQFNDAFFLEKFCGFNVQYFLHHVLWQKVPQVTAKIQALRKRSQFTYEAWERTSSMERKSLTPKIIHKMWITGSGSNASPIPEEALINFRNFVLEFSDWRHIFWVLDRSDIPEEIKQISVPNLEIRAISELPFFRGKSLFDYFFSNSYFCFASNIARFNVLYEFGGLYLDVGWKINPESRHLFDFFNYIFLPNQHGFIDVWCGFMKKHNRILYAYLNYLNSFRLAAIHSQNRELPLSISLFCVVPFTSFIYAQLEENDSVLLAPHSRVFQPMRLNSWLTSKKYKNTPAASLPMTTELPKQIFPKRTRIANIGFFNEQNCGDELFNLVFSHFLYPYHVEKIPFHLMFQRKDCSQDFDLIVIGGGDLIDFNSSTLPVFFPQFPASKRIYICGVGVHNQEKHNQASVDHTRTFLEDERVSMIGLRDEESKAALQPLTHKEINVFPDLVFSLALPYQIPLTKKVIGIILRNVNEGSYNLGINDFEHLRNTIVERLLQNNFEVKIISLRNIVSESQPIKDVFLSKHPSITYCPYETPDKNIDDIKNCDFILTMRYHGAILAAMLGIPMIALDVSDKFRALKGVLERSDVVTNPKDPDLFDKIMTTPPVAESTILRLRMRSRAQLEMLKIKLDENSNATE